MTKHIKSINQRFKDWRKKVKKREKEDEIETAKETIIFNLTDNLTTEESLQMFKDIKAEFYELMNKRLERVIEEKTNLEEFLQKY